MTVSIYRAGNFFLKTWPFIRVPKRGGVIAFFLVVAYNELPQNTQTNSISYDVACAQQQSYWFSCAVRHSS